MYICDFCGRQSGDRPEECRGCGSVEFMKIPEHPAPPAFSPILGDLPQNMSASTDVFMASISPYHSWYRGQNNWRV